MAYGNTTPPEGAPVPQQELIGAALFLGLVAVVSISRHGAYLIGFIFGRFPLDAGPLLLFVLNLGGFVASLWLLALRRWAWQGAIAYALVEIGLRAFYLFSDLAPGLGLRVNGRVDPLGAIGELFLALVFLVVLAYLLGEDTTARLAERERFRATQA
ncbi:MAG: hypothetical protein M3010_05895 [Candidatus Dormibacteraeota bacterium]|nr:hypothetical protein [Candidatus Dormibacteraeota bacterium]